MQTHFGIHKTEIIGDYMETLFSAELQGKADKVPLPNWWLDELDLLEDCNYAIKVLAQASKNQSMFSFGFRMPADKFIRVDELVDQRLYRHSQDWGTRSGGKTSPDVSTGRNRADKQPLCNCRQGWKDSFMVFATGD
jgi:hypothetical protein